MLEKCVFLQKSFEEVLDLFEFLQVFFGVNLFEWKILSFILEKTQDRCISNSLGLNAVEVMERFSLIWQSFQQLCVNFLLLPFNQIHLCKNLILWNFQLQISIPHFKKFFNGISKISLILDIHLIKFPSIVDSKERCYLFKSFFPCPLKFLKNILNPLDKLNLFILRDFFLLDFSVEDLIVFLLRIEKRFNFRYMLLRFCTNEGFQSILNSI